MTVYTVTSTDDMMSEPLQHLVVGSYTSRGLALDECAAYMLERVGRNPDIAWMASRDENHPDASRFFEEDEDGCTVVAHGKGEELRAYLRDALAGEGCYYVYDGADGTWHVDIDENDVEGGMWFVVTCGESNVRRDDGFTRPWPEAYASEEAALCAVVAYLRDLLESYGEEIPDDFETEVRKALLDGKAYHLDLGDDVAMNAVLYHSDARNIK